MGIFFVPLVSQNIIVVLMVKHKTKGCTQTNITFDTFIRTLFPWSRNSRAPSRLRQLFLCRHAHDTSASWAASRVLLRCDLGGEVTSLESPHALAPFRLSPRRGSLHGRSVHCGEKLLHVILTEKTEHQNFYQDYKFYTI